MLGTSGNVHLQTGCVSIVMFVCLFVCLQYRFCFQEKIEISSTEKDCWKQVEGGIPPGNWGWIFANGFLWRFFSLPNILSSELPDLTLGAFRWVSEWKRTPKSTVWNGDVDPTLANQKDTLNHLGKPTGFFVCLPRHHFSFGSLWKNNF